MNLRRRKPSLYEAREIVRRADIARRKADLVAYEEGLRAEIRRKHCATLGHMWESVYEYMPFSLISYAHALPKQICAGCGAHGDVARRATPKPRAPQPAKRARSAQ